MNPELENNQPEIDKCQKELKHIYEEKAEGAKIRSRIQWWESGEKSTKYFHNLEKRNAKEKVWERILDKENAIQYGTQNIMKCQVEFYNSLYTSQDTCQEKQDKFLACLDKEISEDNRIMLDQDITIDEANKAVNLMKCNKSPGPDGIIVEFYKCFWNIIGGDLLQIYDNSFKNEELPYTQYMAIITLLYKKGQREDITNWRPISLLNVDVKILSKILAERLKRVLPELIHVDQRGCIKGRHIGENIRLVEDVINAYDSEELILLLDQQKAFDSVEWSWLMKVLQKFW